MRIGITKTYGLNTAGNISVMAAICFTAVLLLAGLAINTLRLHSTASSLQDMADSAALAAVSIEDMTEDERKELAGSTLAELKENLSGDISFLPEQVSLADDGDTITVTTSADVPVLFGGLMGRSNGRVVRQSKATRLGGDDFTPTSIMFVLDASGSMNATMDGSPRISILKSSVMEIFEEFEVGTDAELRLRTGVYAYNWGIRDADSQPLANGWTHTVGAVNAMGLGNATIPTQALEVAVNDLIQEPNTFDGDSRDKVIVFMTDGEVDDHLNMNGRSSQYADYNNPPSSGSFSSRVINACTQAHNNGIAIIAVGMNAPLEGRQLLQDCVATGSNPKSVYVNATNGMVFEDTLELAIPTRESKFVRLVK